MKKFSVNTSAKFISFEGIDGCGKTTQAKMLVEFLKKHEIKCIYTSEPDSSKIGRYVREMISQGNLDGKSELLLFSFARRQHLKEVIFPALESNIWVICDRFIDSTLCYQGIFKEIKQDFIYNLHKDFCYDVWPDITFILDILPKISKERIILRKSKLSGYDSLSDSQYDILRQGFLLLTKKFCNRIKLINAEASQLDLHNTVVSEISDRYSSI